MCSSLQPLHGQLFQTSNIWLLPKKMGWCYIFGLTCHICLVQYCVHSHIRLTCVKWRPLDDHYVTIFKYVAHLWLLFSPIPSRFWFSPRVLDAGGQCIERNPWRTSEWGVGRPPKLGGWTQGRETRSPACSFKNSRITSRKPGFFRLLNKKWMNQTQLYFIWSGECPWISSLFLLSAVRMFRAKLTAFW